MVIISASLVSLDSHQAGCEGDWEAVRIMQASGDESQK